MSGGMNGLPYYKAYPRDFIEGTIGMGFETKCAYRVVIDLIYMQGGNLPDDARYISGLLGCSIRKWKSIRQELVKAGKLVVSGEFLTNYRAISELETLAKLQEKQAENASGPRKNKGLEKPRQNHTEPEPEPEKDISPSGRSASPEKSAEAEVYRLGLSVLGKKAGGVITDLRKACEKDDAYALDLLRQAAEKHDPMAWVQGVLKSGRMNRKVVALESRADREYREWEDRYYRTVDSSPLTPDEIAYAKANGLS